MSEYDDHDIHKIHTGDYRRGRGHSRRRPPHGERYRHGSYYDDDNVACFMSDDGDDFEDGRFLSSRPSSRGDHDQDSLASTSRPGSRQSTRSRPGSRQRPFSAVSFADSVDFQEQERQERRRRQMDTPNTLDGMMFDEEASYNDDGHHGGYGLSQDRGVFSRGMSRGGIHSRGGFSSSTGDTRPPSGRSSLRTPGTPGTRDIPGTRSTSAADDSFAGRKMEEDGRLDTELENKNGDVDNNITEDGGRSPSSPHSLYSPPKGGNHEHTNDLASFVDMSGNFVTDDFIEALLGFKAGDPSLKVHDPEEEEEVNGEARVDSTGASKKVSTPSSGSGSPLPLLDPNTVRLRVDKLREDVNAKRAADEAAKGALANGQGSDGVRILRSNAELDGNLENHFPGHDYLLAKVGVSSYLSNTHAHTSTFLISIILISCDSQN